MSYCDKNHLKVEFVTDRCPACAILKERAMFEMFRAQEVDEEATQYCSATCEETNGSFCDICKVNGGNFDPRRD